MKKLNKKQVIKIGIALLIIFTLLLLLLLNKSKLNNVEMQVYNKVLEYINEGDFFNPKEVRLLDANVEFDYDETERKYIAEIKYYYFKLSGTNKVGGTINKCYWSYYSSYSNKWSTYENSCSDLEKTGTNKKRLSSKSIKNINKELKKYWQNLGL